MKRLRRPRRRRGLRRKPVNLLASVITTCNLYCGLWSIFAGISGHYEQAAYLVLAAIIFDSFDGAIARITKSVSAFGGELDSLSDQVSFGVAPAVLIYTTYLREYNEEAFVRFGSVFAILYAISAALRLARYNVFQSDIRDYFIGLPAPAAGGTIASFVLFTQYFEVKVAFWVLGPLTLLLAVLMVSNVRYPKSRIKHFLLAPQNAFRYLAAFGIVIAVLHYAIEESPAIVLFPLGMCYVGFGVLESGYDFARHGARDESPHLDIAEKPQSPSSETVSNTDDAL